MLKSKTILERLILVNSVFLHKLVCMYRILFNLHIKFFGKLLLIYIFLRIFLCDYVSVIIFLWHKDEYNPTHLSLICLYIFCASTS